jgi:hypothetical protein
MMLTIIIEQTLNKSTGKNAAFLIHKDDVNFKINDIITINVEGQAIDAKVIYITNRVYKFVNIATGELTNNEAILYKMEIPVITKNDLITTTQQQ